MAQSIPLQDLSQDGSLQPARRGGAWSKIVERAPQASAALSLGRAAAGVLKPATAKVIRQEGPVLKASTTAPRVATRNEVAENDEAARALAAEVRRAQQGDSYAMAELIENNRAWVRGIAYTVLGDAHLAEDAAQEVCVRVVKHLRGLDTPEAFRPWVYRMTRNVALSMAQRRERTPQPLSLEAEQMQEGGFKFSRSEQPGAALEEDERVSGILDTISRLPEIYREVLVLKHVQDLSYTEMSAILGVSVKSLEVRLVRARKLLQDRLGRRFDRGRKRDPREDRE